jgi:hypothetical protein
MSMVCERGWGGQAADFDWSVPPPLLEWHSDVFSCHLCYEHSAGFVRKKWWKKDSIYPIFHLCLIKDGTVFPILCITNPSSAALPSQESCAVKQFKWIYSRGNPKRGLYCEMSVSSRYSLYKSSPKH